MSAAGVIEAVDVFEKGNFDLPAGLPVSAPNHFRLEGFEKALDGSIVIAVTFAAHRCRQAVFAQDFLVYRFYFKTRKFSWVMTQKLSDTLSRKFFHSCGMVSRMNTRMASANCF